MDRETGHLTFQEDVVTGGGPAPLAIDPGQRFLYAGLRSACQVASFRIEQGTGRLSPIGTIALDTDPCFMITDRTGRYLLSSYYRGGGVSVHRIGSDGAATSPPLQWISTAPKAHSIQTDASNRFAFVPHVMDANVILQFAFDEGTGRLAPNAVPRAFPASGEGPRHFCFHPSLDVVYFVNEQGGSVSAYRLDPDAGTLEAMQTVSTLPAAYQGQNTCAQVHITPSGRFLYAANRGHDSIAVFAIDAMGRLAAAGQQPTEEIPRAFNVDPGSQFLLVSGRASGRLVVYRIDDRSGALTPLETHDVGARPMWVLVLDLAAN
jgi:6-phosphogluconolactonase